MKKITIAAHYPDELPLDIIVGSTSRRAQYTVGDLRALLKRAALPTIVTPEMISAAAKEFARLLPPSIQAKDVTHADLRAVLEVALRGG